MPQPRAVALLLDRQTVLLHPLELLRCREKWFACEAVVEGMGGVWDRCDRQGNWVTATEEAVIAWNAPQPYHPVAVPFINRALENWGGLNWEDRFHHNDRSRAQRGGIGASLQRGLVMTRKKAETQRLPAECYDVRPKPRGHN